MPMPWTSSRPAAGAKAEPRWPADLAIVVAMVLYGVLPDPLISGPRWLLPTLEGAILVTVSLGAPRRHAGERRVTRVLAIMLIALANAGNVASLYLLLHSLVAGEHIPGRTLILSAIAIYLTNVIVFGLWYWELDRGGPAARLRPDPPPPDFLFPQMNAPNFAAPNWRAGFLDYLFTSLTNATAFSPTDTLPLTPMAKSLFGAQALASLLTVALVAGRAVNVL